MLGRTRESGDATIRRLKTMAAMGAFATSTVARALMLGEPPQRSVEERLRQLQGVRLPVRSPVEFLWNEHHVPFIDAAHDDDLAVALGAVHGHLRLTQIELMRRIARGRLSEIVGPAAVEIDRTVRTLDLTRAVPAMAADLPSETNSWIDGFTRGLNAYAEQVTERPHDFAALGMKHEPWSIEDVLAVSRLAAMDFTWKVWMRLLALRGRSDWVELWGRLIGGDDAPVPSFGGNGSLGDAMGRFGRGSNSVAISASRSASGSAIIASDPHLSVTLPNLWMIVGYRSPGHHAVGLMIPGIPVLALGRNRWIAWGGTSLHAASSELFDVGDLPAHEIVERTVRIKVRGRRDRAFTARDTRYGPIVSDVPMLKDPQGKRLALRWVGHLPSADIPAMLAVSRARDWESFQEALDGFAIPALNMVYADASGRVGQAMAAKLPRRPLAAPEDMVAPRAARRHWAGFVTATGLPARVDPESGFVASANDAPEGADVRIGDFFASEERVVRLRHLLSKDLTLDMADLRRIQQDVSLPSAPALRDGMIAAIEAAGAARPGTGQPVVDALRNWDGRHDADSAGALAFELLAYHLAVAFHGRRRMQVYAATWDVLALVRRDIRRTESGEAGKAVVEAVRRAARAFRRLRVWGAAHRLRLAHPLSALPLVGRRFLVAEHPSGGSNETVMKTAHGFAGGRHRVRFGANARHVSDLSDPDANDFALLGGQDGFLGSTTFADQVPLWRDGHYIRVPMNPDKVRRTFRHSFTLDRERGPI